ncbi:MAG: bifunctional precorrin-2 dehydrogenase/sirohydrochlorin ferrochelatase [Candidatus Omnitrophica bacterium]|nr:bifunctional precorrin-2 dehydrogenase/sirohydrochlorin ferrochelatase [Candidatus Omnitrophota bacterium]
MKLCSYMPVCLKVKGENCLVVGGGKVAYRKISVFRNFGAKITCISPEIIAPIERLRSKGKIKCIKSLYPKNISLKKYKLIVAATDNAKVNKKVLSDANKANTLVNVVDKSGPGSIIMPAILKRKGLTIGISTNGQSPAKAKAIRDKLANAI